MQCIPNDCSKTMGLMKQLQVTISARVELSANVNVEDGLANGSSGIVKWVQVNATTQKPEFVSIKFDHTGMGKTTRSTYTHLYQQQAHIHPSWTPIPQMKQQLKVGRYKCAEVLQCQFPLRPAAAKTAHTCQGDTMESAVVSFQG